MTWVASVQRGNLESDILCDDATAEMYCPLKNLNDFFQTQMETKFYWFVLWSNKILNEFIDIYLKSKYYMKIKSTPGPNIILLK